MDDFFEERKTAEEKGVVGEAGKENGVEPVDKMKGVQGRVGEKVAKKMKGGKNDKAKVYEVGKFFTKPDLAILDAKVAKKAKNSGQTNNKVETKPANREGKGEVKVDERDEGEEGHDAQENKKMRGPAVEELGMGKEIVEGVFFLFKIKTFGERMDNDKGVGEDENEAVEGVNQEKLSK